MNALPSASPAPGWSWLFSALWDEVALDRDLQLTGVRDGQVGALLAVAEVERGRLGRATGSGLVTQEPTTDRPAVIAAIDRLRPDGGTALGSGLQTALTSIVGQPVLVDATDIQGVEPQGPDLGYHGSAAVVLLSDGENTDGPDPLELAEIASSAGVRVYPIGLGRPEGTVLEIDGFQIATALDEPLLREIAARTDGRYFAAADEQALAAVYDSIELTWTVRAEHIEVTAALAAAAALLVLCGVGLSLTWFGRAV